MEADNGIPVSIIFIGLRREGIQVNPVGRDFVRGSII